MPFTSEEDAYRFYNAYAGKIGLSMKCHTKHRADGHYLQSTLFAVMKVIRTLIQNINQRKNALQQGHVAMLVFNSMFHEKESGRGRKSYSHTIIAL